VILQGRKRKPGRKKELDSDMEKHNQCKELSHLPYRSASVLEILKKMQKKKDSKKWSGGRIGC